MEKAVTGEFRFSSNIYFEKFFPTSIRIPVVDAEALKVIGVRRLVSTLDSQGWFEVDVDRKTYKEEIEKIWDEQIAPFCQTPRAVGLLVNDLNAAALSLRGEVNPVDLTLIEMLRRFEPSVYEIVWRHRETFTGQENSWARYRYRSDEQKAAFRKSLLEELGKAVENDERLDSVKSVLGYLFPLFAKIDGQRRLARGPKAEGIDAENKIADPRMTAAYFYQKLPESLFSSKEMNEFLRTTAKSPDADTTVRELSKVLDSMEKGSPKRENFLEKLSEKMNTVNLPLATELVHAAMLVACKYSYDIFVTAGEAGDALRMVIRVAKRTEEEDQRAAFLSRCILETGDDTLAFRIQTSLSKPGSDFNLGVTFAELYPSFVRRMRLRYGPDIDAQAIDLACSDPRAFQLWASPDLTKEGVTVDPEDKSIQHRFWLNYIGNSASRLSQVFNRFFMPEGYAYSSDPTPFVESMIPVSDLRKLYESHVSEESLSQTERDSLQRLGDFLEGKFKNGISPFGSSPE